MPTVTDFISRQTPKEIISPASDKEKAAIEILMGINKITECLDQIYFSIEMLSGFRKKKNSKMNRHDYIVFMIEYFYLRITSIFDRSLRFSNLVFDIGLPERECRESTIIKNSKIKGTKVEESLKKLNKFTLNFKQIRNQVAHSDAFEDQELYPIRDYYYLIEDDNPGSLNNYKHIFKTRTDRYVHDKKNELTESAEQISDLIHDFFDSIVPYVETRINGK